MNKGYKNVPRITAEFLSKSIFYFVFTEKCEITFLQVLKTFRFSSFLIDGIDKSLKWPY